MIRQPIPDIQGGLKLPLTFGHPVGYFSWNVPHAYYIICSGKVADDNFHASSKPQMIQTTNYPKSQMIQTSNDPTTNDSSQPKSNPLLLLVVCPVHSYRQSVNPPLCV